MSDEHHSLTASEWIVWGMRVLGASNDYDDIFFLSQYLFDGMYVTFVNRLETSNEQRFHRYRVCEGLMAQIRVSTEVSKGRSS